MPDVVESTPEVEGSTEGAVEGTSQSTPAPQSTEPTITLSDGRVVKLSEVPNLLAAQEAKMKEMDLNWKRAYTKKSMERANPRPSPEPKQVAPAPAKEEDTGPVVSVSEAIMLKTAIDYRLEKLEQKYGELTPEQKVKFYDKLDQWVDQTGDLPEFEDVFRIVSYQPKTAPAPAAAEPKATVPVASGAPSVPPPAKPVGKMEDSEFLGHVLRKFPSFKSLGE
jgi:hypothetical protein